VRTAKADGEEVVPEGTERCGKHIERSLVKRSRNGWESRKKSVSGKVPCKEIGKGKAQGEIRVNRKGWKGWKGAKRGGKQRQMERRWCRKEQSGVERQIMFFTAHLKPNKKFKC
jgi:hypothetical protein